MNFEPDTHTEMTPLDFDDSGTKGQKRKGIMLCYPFEEKRLNKWGGKVIVQPKLDGERCRAILKDGTITLLSSEMNIITSVPHIIKNLQRTGLDNIELDGELYIHGQPFEEIHSRVSRKVNLHPKHEEVEFHVFDVVSEEPQIDRTRFVINNLLNYESVKIVPSTVTDDLEEVMNCMSTYVREGYEGIIIRHYRGFYVRRRSTQIMKFKPRKKDSYKVVGVVQERDKYGDLKYSLGALICQDDMGTQFQVGSGFTAQQRKYYWENKHLIVGKKVVVKYQHITPGRNVPRFPVFAEVK